MRVDPSVVRHSECQCTARTPRRLPGPAGGNLGRLLSQREAFVAENSPMPSQSKWLLGSWRHRCLNCLTREFRHSQLISQSDHVCSKSGKSKFRSIQEPLLLPGFQKLRACNLSQPPANGRPRLILDFRLRRYFSFFSRSVPLAFRRRSPHRGRSCLPAAPPVGPQSMS